jgi:hypothetical protein
VAAFRQDGGTGVCCPLASLERLDEFQLVGGEIAKSLNFGKRTFIAGDLSRQCRLSNSGQGFNRCFRRYPLCYHASRRIRNAGLVTFVNDTSARPVTNSKRPKIDPGFRKIQ